MPGKLGAAAIALLLLAGALSPRAGAQGPGERSCPLEIKAAQEFKDVTFLVTPFCLAGKSPEQAWQPCSTIRKLNPPHARLLLACPSSGGPGGYLLTGDGAGPQWLESGDLDPNRPVTLRPTGGTALRLCIRGQAASRPLGIVQLVLEAPEGIPAPGVLEAEVKSTGEDGCAEWPHLPGFSGHVVASALGFRSRVNEVSVPSEGPDVSLTLELSPAGRKLLPVRNEIGEALEIGMARLDWTVGYVSTGTLDVQVDPNGKVALPYFDVGAIDLEIHSPCCASFQERGIRPAGLAELSRIILKRFGEVRGRIVLEEEPDEPVMGARVCLVSAEEGDDAESRVCVESGSDGSFTAGGLRDGRHSVSVEVSERPRLVLPGVPVSPAETTDLDEIPVPRGAVVRLQVLDGIDGGSIPGASVVLDREEFGVPWGRRVEAATDEEGMAELRGFREGTYRFMISSTGYSPKLVELEAEPADEAVQEVFLTSGGVLRGSVLRNGEPAAGDRIVIPLAPEPYVGLVDDLGAYRIENLPPGTVTVERHSPYGDSVELKEAVIDPTRETILDFGHGLELLGRVFRRGEPLRGARLALLRIRDWDREQKGQAGELMLATGVFPTVSPEILSAVTDLRGEFHMGGLEPGEYSLTIMYDSSTQTRRIQVSQDREEPVRIEIAGFELNGSVIFGESGEPVAQARIMATLAGGTGGSYSRMGEIAGQQMSLDSRDGGRTGTNAAGDFSLYLSQPGPWLVMAHAKGSVSEPLLVEDTSAGPVEIAIHPRSVIEVWVQGPGGVEVDVARVHAMRRASNAPAPSMSTHSTDRSGKVRLRGVQGEEWWIAATHPSFGMSEMRRVRYPESGEVTERLELGRGGTLTVELDGDGEQGAAPPWDIRHQDSGLSLRGLIPDPALGPGSGRMRLVFRQLPSTSLTVRVGEHEAAIRIESGATQSLDLRTGPEPGQDRDGGLR